MSEEKKEEENNQKEQEEEEANVESQKPERLVIMKKGDYNVHILIEEVKNLLEIEDNCPPRPCVKMTVFGKSKRTPKVKPCDSYIFNEHFYFDKTNLTAEMLDSEKVVIEVYDTKHSKKKDYFGIYELDFSYIYNQEEHSLHNVWIGLANPESDDITKIRGYLKISISVLHEGDERIELISLENEISNCIIPSQIQMTYKQLSFYFIRGEDFPDMDEKQILQKKIHKKKKDCDGYIEVKYMGIMKKTNVVSMDANDQYRINWNQKVDIPATQPAISQKVIMVVKDDDGFNKFDIVGSIEVKVDDIFAGKYNDYQYLDIYGSPINQKDGIFDLVNYNAEIGSKWNGRILMKCTVSDIGAPVVKLSDLSKEEVKEALSHSRKFIWKIWVRIISAMYLPEDSKEYGIRISIQEKSELIQPRKAINGSIDFDETKNILLNTFSGDKAELPELFIYLVEKSSKKNICFQRVKASEFHLNKDILIIKLLPDPFIGKCNNMRKSGIIKCKICVYSDNETNLIPTEKEFKAGGIMPPLKTLGKKVSKVFDIDDFENLKNEKEEEPEPEPIADTKNLYTIIAVVYMSKGLVAAESSGTSDPYVEIKYEDQSHETSRKNNTMNGIWNEKLEFPGIRMDLNDIATWPVFQVSVIDYNRFKSHLPLGYNYLWLCNSAYTLNDIESREPKWHKLFLPKSNKQQGQILLSFYIFDDEHKHLIPNIKIQQKVTMYDFEINILGLRQLKPLGLIEVKKPFIKFDLNSLNVTGNPEDAHANVQTIPQNGGANPTINTVIKFDVKLPEKDIFMPELQCEVYDHMLGGLHNSLLGVFSLDLKRIIKKTRRQIDEDLNSVRGKFGTGILNDFVKTSLKGKNLHILNLPNNIIGGNGMTEKSGTDTIIEEKKEEEKNDLFNKDPLTALKEVDEKEIEAKNLTDISKEINKKKEGEEEKENHEDDDSEKNSEEHLLEEKKEEDIDINTIKIDELQVAVPSKDGKSTLRNTMTLKRDVIKTSLNYPEYFVAFPILKPFKIPGYESKMKQKDKIEIVENGGENKLEKIEEEKEENPPEQMEKLVEDDKNVIKTKENGQIEKIEEIKEVGEEEEEEEKIQKEFFVEDTSKAPDKRFYFEVGYLLKVEHEIKQEEATKHYRRIYGCPLEYCKELNLRSPFKVKKIRRGKYVDKVQVISLFDALKDVKSKVIFRYGEELAPSENSSRTSKLSELSQEGFLEKKNKDEKYYGKFKGLIRIVEKDKQLEYEKEIKKCQENGDIEKMKNLNRYEGLKKKLITKKEIIVRIYVLELNELAKKDLLSESDPYIKILVNDKEVINERNNYQEDQKNCKWYKYYDIPAEIPGSSTLKIEVWDWDEILSDDLIGTTTIDLEDRYYNDDWQNMKYKPIEVRPLLHPDIEGSQGKVIMWLEMFDADKKSTEIPWKIDPQPICELQVRFVVWETEEMEMMDIEGTSDIYVIGYIEQKESQKTDIHFRCQTGVASFNWRMLLPLKLPVQRPLLTIQVYDKDIFSSDDYMCGATINMKDIINIPKLLEMPVGLTRDFYEDLTDEEKETLGEIEFLSPEDDEEGIKFWVQCYKGRKEVTGKGEKSGRVMCSLEILPKKIADTDIVGKGRDDPNVNPYLPPPVGRIQFTLNPFKMMNQCVGPKFRKKCYFYCLCCLLVIYLIFTLPNIMSSAIF